MHSNNGRSYKYDAEEFRKALPLFKETDVVFANTHPQNIGKLPIEDALKEVNGRLAGTPQDVIVNNTGTLFRGSVNLTDSEANELAKEGKLLISTAFSATPDNEGVLRNIIPNHILVYPLDTAILPGDQGALFLNQSEKNGQSDIKMVEDTKNEQLDLMRELVLNQNAKDELQAKITEQNELIFNQKTQLEDKDKVLAQKAADLSKKEELIANQASTIEALNGKVSELSQKIEEIKISEKNKRRERIYNQYLTGTKKAFEARKEEIFDDLKYEDLIFEMNQHQAGIAQPPTEPSGVTEVQNQGKLAEDEEAKKAWTECGVRF